MAKRTSEKASFPPTGENPEQTPTDQPSEVQETAQEPEAPKPPEAPEPAPTIPTMPRGDIPEAMFQISTRRLPTWIRWMPEHRQLMAETWLDPKLPVQALPEMEIEDAHRVSRWKLTATAKRIKAQYLPYHNDQTWQDQVVQAVDQLVQHRAFLGAVPVRDVEILQAGALTMLEVNPIEWQFQLVGKNWQQVAPENSLQFRFDILLTYLGPVEA